MESRFFDTSNTRVKILNISHETTDEEISTLFAKFGRVKRVELLRTDANGKMKKYGFHGMVEFDTEAAAQDAFEKMNGYELHGQVLEVIVSKGDKQEEEEEEEEPSSAGVDLIVLNLNQELFTLEKLVALVDKFAGYLTCRVEYDKNDEVLQTKKPKFALVGFSTMSFAESAMRVLNGKTLDGKIIKVELKRGSNSFFSPQVKSSQYSIPEAPSDRANSFKFSNLIQEFTIIATSSYEVKLDRIFKHIRPYLKGQSMWPIMRLMFPQHDRERPNYNIKEKELANLIIKALSLDVKTSAQANRLKNFSDPSLAMQSKGSTGNFAQVVKEIMDQRERASVKCTLTVGQVNGILDELCKYSRNASKKVELITHLVDSCNSNELSWVCRIIIKDMALKLSEEKVLKTYHPDAPAALNAHGDLRRVLAELPDPNIRRVFDVEMFSPCQPMVACQPKNPQMLASELGDFAMEEKLDGERLVCHVDFETNQVTAFTRAGKNYTDKYCNAVFLQSLREAFSKGVKRCIVDGEMMAWDEDKQRYLAFGQNVTVALAMRSEGGGMLRQWLTYVIFDVLFVELKEPHSYGNTLGVITGWPLSSRREMLEKMLVTVEKRIVLMPQVKVLNVPPGLEQYNVAFKELNAVIGRGGEGIVLKSLAAPYVGGEMGRKKGHWVKFKPDYLEGGAETFDLLFLGGLYADNNREKFAQNDWKDFSKLLFGVKRRGEGDEEERPTKFLVFAKIASGFTGALLAELRRLVADHLVKYDKDNPPAHFEQMKKAEDVCDVWVPPEHSVVCEVRGTEIVPSDVFSAGYCLRFPRFIGIRNSSKAWYECEDEEFMLNRFANQAKRLENMADTTKHEFSRAKLRQTRGEGNKRQKRVPSVMERFGNVTDLDRLVVPQTGSTLKGYTFFLFPGDAPAEVAFDTHAEISPSMSFAEVYVKIKENGGEVTKSFGVGAKPNKKEPLAVKQKEVILAPYLENAKGDVHPSLKNLVENPKVYDVFYFSFIHHVVACKRTIDHPAFSDYLLISDATIERLGPKVVSSYGEFYFDTIRDVNRYYTLGKVAKMRRAPASTTTTTSSSSSKAIFSMPYADVRDILLQEEDDPLFYAANSMRGMKCLFVDSAACPHLDLQRERVHGFAFHEVEQARKFCLLFGGEQVGAAEEADCTHCVVPRNFLVTKELKKQVNERFASATEVQFVTPQYFNKVIEQQTKWELVSVGEFRVDVVASPTSDLPDSAEDLWTMTQEVDVEEELS